MLALLATSLIASLAINLSMFLVAYKAQSDKLTDISYAVTFATLALLGFWRSDGELYHVLLLMMILAWATRLGGFLLYRVIKNGRDRRFDGMREDFVKFGKFWLGQALTVWVLMIPSMFVFGAGSSTTLLMLAGIVVWGVGLLTETAADYQKLVFARNPKNTNKWIESGIWKYSRHPNYFGEVLVWTGLYVYAAFSLPAAQVIVGLISPLFITTLLLFVSGVPILEKSADKKWGKLRAYQDYKKRTSLLVPLPNKKAS